MLGKLNKKWKDDINTICKKIIYKGKIFHRKMKKQGNEKINKCWYRELKRRIGFGFESLITGKLGSNEVVTNGYMLTKRVNLYANN